MRKLFKKTVCCIALLGMLVCACSGVLAVTPSASIAAPSSAAVGNTITVTITLRGDDVLGAEFELKFDPAALRYVSSSDGNKTSSNTVKNIIIANSPSSSVSCTVRFKALKAGSTTLQVANCSIYNVDLATIGSPTSAKAITITAAASSGGTQSSETTPQKNIGLQTAVETQINGKSVMLWSILDGVALPQGFAAAESPYLQNQIDMAVNASKTLSLVYTTDKDGKNPAFYIYDNGVFYDYLVLSPAQKSYTILPVPETVTPPEEYPNQTTLQITGLGSVTAWKSELAVYSHLYALYMADDQGKAEFFVYNATDGTVQRYIEYYDPAVPDEEQPEAHTPTFIENLKAVADKILSDDQLFPIVAWLVLLLCGALVWLGIKTRKNDSLLEQLQKAQNAPPETEIIIADNTPVLLVNDPLVDLGELAAADDGTGDQQPMPVSAFEKDAKALAAQAGEAESSVQSTADRSSETGTTEDDSTVAEQGSQKTSFLQRMKTRAAAKREAKSAKRLSDSVSAEQGSGDLDTPEVSNSEAIEDVLNESTPHNGVVHPETEELSAKAETAAAEEAALSDKTPLPEDDLQPDVAKALAAAQKIKESTPAASVAAAADTTLTRPESPTVLEISANSEEIVSQADEPKPPKESKKGLFARIRENRAEKLANNADREASDNNLARQAADDSEEFENLLTHLLDKKGDSESKNAEPKLAQNKQNKTANTAENTIASADHKLSAKTDEQTVRTTAKTTAHTQTPQPAASSLNDAQSERLLSANPPAQAAKPPVAAEGGGVFANTPAGAEAVPPAQGSPLPEAQEYRAPYSPQATAAALFHTQSGEDSKPAAMPADLPQCADARAPAPVIPQLESKEPDPRALEEINISRLVDRYKSAKKKDTPDSDGSK